MGAEVLVFSAARWERALKGRDTGGAQQNRDRGVSHGRTIPTRMTKEKKEGNTHAPGQILVNTNSAMLFRFSSAGPNTVVNVNPTSSEM